MNNAKYSVCISNVGNVWNGATLESAIREYKECVQLSKNDYGRFGGESVTIFKHDEIIKEFIGANEND